MTNIRIIKTIETIKMIDYKQIATIACSLLFCLLFGFLAHCASLNVDKQDVLFNDLSDKVYNISWANESILKTDKSIPDGWRKSDVGQEALTDLIKSMSHAGKLISKPLFCKILFLAQQNDVLLKSNSIDRAKLMTEQQSINAKHDLVELIRSEQADHHSFLSGLGTIFGDDSAKKYTTKDCEAN